MCVLLSGVRQEAARIKSCQSPEPEDTSEVCTMCNRVRPCALVEPLSEKSLYCVSPSLHSYAGKYQHTTIQGVLNRHRKIQSIHPPWSKHPHWGGVWGRGVGGGGGGLGGGVYSEFYTTRKL